MLKVLAVSWLLAALIATATFADVQEKFYGVLVLLIPAVGGLILLYIQRKSGEILDAIKAMGRRSTRRSTDDEPGQQIEQEDAP